MYDWGWDWDCAIERNRGLLLRLLLSLFALARIASPDGSGDVLPRRLRSYIVKLLRPAESAGRRLVVLYSVVHALKVPALPDRSRGGPLQPIVPKDVLRAPSFPLRDVRKRFDRVTRHRGRKPLPHLTIIGLTERVVEEVPEIGADDPLDAKRLLRRMAALKNALDDLPKQAKRLMRFEARRLVAPPGPKCVPALRYGTPPGHRKRPIHPVDEILAECALLYRYALKPPPS